MNKVGTLFFFVFVLIGLTFSAEQKSKTRYEIVVDEVMVCIEELGVMIQEIIILPREEREKKKKFKINFDETELKQEDKAKLEFQVNKILGTSWGKEIQKKDGNPVINRRSEINKLLMFKDVLNQTINDDNKLERYHLISKILIALVNREGYVPEKEKKIYIDECNEILNKALDLDPDNIDTIYLVGYLAENKGDKGLMIEMYSDVHAKSPNYLNCYFKVCKMYQINEDYKKMESCLLELIQKDPQHLEGLETLAKYYYENLKNVKYEETLRKIIELTQKKEDYEKLFKFYIIFNKDDKALEIVSKINELFPSLEYMKIEAEMLFDIKEYEKAEEIYEKILEKEKKNERALFNLGKIKFLSKEYQSAVKYFSKMGRSNNIELLKMLGESYFNTEEYNNAMRVFTKLLELEDDLEKRELIAVYEWRSQTHVKLGNLKKGENDSQTAKQILENEKQ